MQNFRFTCLLVTALYMLSAAAIGESTPQAFEPKIVTVAIVDALPWAGRDENGQLVGWARLLDWPVIQRVYPNAEIKIILAPNKRNRQEFLAGRVDIIAAYEDPVIKKTGHKLVQVGALPVHLWLKNDSSISSLQDALKSLVISTPPYKALAAQTFANVRFLPTNEQFPELLFSRRYDGAIASTYSFMYQAQQSCIALEEFKSIPVANPSYYYWLRKDKGHEAFIERWHQVVKEESIATAASRNREQQFSKFLSDVPPEHCDAP